MKNGFDEKNSVQERERLSENPLYRPEIPKDSEKGFPLLRITNQFYNMDDLVLDSEIKLQLENMINENLNSKKLYAKAMKPKQNILFCGPAGTGKTFAAKVISSVTTYPFVYVLFDSIVSSFLGETATNLRKIFSFIEKGRFVVLFDEFDVVGKKRDDPHEHGEIKRVVNNFIQMLDNYHGESIIIAATNHPHLLDTAVWRRFDEILYFGLPDPLQRKQLFIKYLRLNDVDEHINLTTFVRKTKDFSGADIAKICNDAIRKSLIENRNNVTQTDLEYSLKEQIRRKKIMYKINS